MSRERFFSDECIILKRTNYGEADKIVTILSYKHGRFAAVAKGVRKTISRKAPHLEPFSQSRLYFAKGANLPIITQASTIESFEEIKKDLQLSGFAFRITETIDKLTVEGEDYPEIYQLLVVALKRLQAGEQDNLVERFQRRLLDLMGYGDQLEDEQVTNYIERLIDRKLKAENMFR